MLSKTFENAVRRIQLWSNLLKNSLKFFNGLYDKHRNKKTSFWRRTWSLKLKFMSFVWRHMRTMFWSYATNTDNYYHKSRKINFVLNFMCLKTIDSQRYTIEAFKASHFIKCLLFSNEQCSIMHKFLRHFWFKVMSVLNVGTIFLPRKFVLSFLGQKRKKT